jgi:hypothetical protein
MPNFKHVIEQAYRQLLLREPDPFGLGHYQQALTNGMSLAALREELIRSAEYAARFPSGTVPPPGGMTPLRVQDGKLFNAAGPARLLGYIICCDDPLTPQDEAIELGWPLCKAEALDQMAANKVTYTDIRLGPSIDRTVFGDGETPGNDGYKLVGNRYDLTQWNSFFWEKIRAILSYAESRGVYVGVSIIDSWVLDHELGPWSEARNIQGYEGGSLAVVQHAPSFIHTQWVKKVVRETAEFHNVVYLDGNESFKGNPSLAWIHGIRDIARAEMAAMGINPPRLFGSNSDRTDDVDYLVSHEQEVPPVGALPVLVTEYNTLPVNQVLVNAKRGWDTGGAVAFAYWAGEHSNAQRAEVLAGLRSIAEGGGATMPDSCPWLVRWQPKVHNVMNGAFQPVPKPVVGGYVVFDSTPRFSHNPTNTQGQPCNNEHNVVCGGRPCEDPRGGVWTLTQGSSPFNVIEHGYQLRLGPIPSTGTYTVRVEARPDAKDALGKPLRVVDGHARTASITVE